MGFRKINMKRSYLSHLNHLKKNGFQNLIFDKGSSREEVFKDVGQDPFSAWDCMKKILAKREVKAKKRGHFPYGFSKLDVFQKDLSLLDLCGKNEKGTGLLQQVIEKESWGVFEEICQTDLPLRVRDVLCLPDLNGQTPLHLLTRKKNDKHSRLFFQNAPSSSCIAKLFQEDDTGWTPLYRSLYLEKEMQGILEKMTGFDFFACLSLLSCKARKILLQLAPHKHQACFSPQQASVYACLCLEKKLKLYLLLYVKNKGLDLPCDLSSVHLPLRVFIEQLKIKKDKGSDLKAGKGFSNISANSLYHLFRQVKNMGEKDLLDQLVS